MLSPPRALGVKYNTLVVVVILTHMGAHYIQEISDLGHKLLGVMLKGGTWMLRKCKVTFINKEMLNRGKSGQYVGSDN